MNKKTSAEYQRAFRQRLREQGLKKKEIWIRPEYEKLLTDIEQQLRHPGSASIGEKTMEEHRNLWQADILSQQIAQSDLCKSGDASVEYLDSTNPSILVTLHAYGDLPVYVAVAGAQILVEAVLCPISMVKDVEGLNLAILETHKYFPLSTISIEHTQTGEPYYNMFGALSSSSAIDDIVLEIETLASNVLQAVGAYQEFLPQSSQRNAL